MTFLRLYEPDQAAGSFKNHVTCHPENIRSDMVLKETANDSVDWRAGILLTVWVLVASQEQLLLTEFRIRITSFGAESCESDMAAFLKTCRLPASEENTSNRYYEGLYDLELITRNLQGRKPHPLSMLNVRGRWRLTVVDDDHNERKKRLNVPSGRLLV